MDINDYHVNNHYESSVHQRSLPLVNPWSNPAAIHGWHRPEPPTRAERLSTEAMRMAKCRKLSWPDSGFGGAAVGVREAMVTVAPYGVTSPWLVPPYKNSSWPLETTGIVTTYRCASSRTPPGWWKTVVQPSWWLWDTNRGSTNGVTIKQCWGSLGYSSWRNEPSTTFGI